MSKRFEAVRDSSQPRRRLWRWTLRLAALLLSTIVGVTAVVQFGLPWWMHTGDRNHVFTSDDGGLRYQVHVPPQYDGETRLPVMVAIHGCGMTGFGWNSMKATTRFNDLADREGFIVVYPTQRMFGDKLNCWRSGDPRHQQRGSGEPALLAGMTRQVIEQYGADPARVHVSGASSGAGTAVILAVTYPEVFATATSVAGGEYGLNRVDPENPEATPPTYTARQAWAQMGDRARRIPLLVVQGESDTVVPPLVATRLVEHWSAVRDLVDDGLLNGSVGIAEQSETVAPEGRHPYVHNTYTDSVGVTVLDLVLVQDMGHVWPGPDGAGLFTDRSGPDASAIAWAFAQRHPMR